MSSQSLFKRTRRFPAYECKLFCCVCKINLIPLNLSKSLMFSQPFLLIIVISVSHNLSEEKKPSSVPCASVLSIESIQYHFIYLSYVYTTICWSSKRERNFFYMHKFHPIEVTQFRGFTLKTNSLPLRGRRILISSVWSSSMTEPWP